MSNWNDATLPEHNCKQCGKSLSETERYLGIYTGICNACMYMPAYIIACYKIDNCLIISHPPNSPSHRRDRAEHHAYIDCQFCKGTGHIYQSHSFGTGGSYYRYCMECLIERFCKQPMRASYDAMVEEIQKTKITPYKTALDRQFSDIIPAELKEKDYEKYTEEDKKVYTTLSEPLLKQYDDFKETALHISHLLYGKAYEKIEYKPGVIFL